MSLDRVYATGRDGGRDPRHAPLTPTVHVGLGPIGLSVLKSVASRSWAAVQFGVDMDPDLRGQDLAALTEGRAAGPIHGRLGAVEPPGSAEVVVLCTGSRLADVEGQVLEALAWGARDVHRCGAAPG